MYWLKIKEVMKFLIENNYCKHLKSATQAELV